MMNPIYEQRLRALERRATVLCCCGLICLVLSVILLLSRPAVSQTQSPSVFKAPFRVVDEQGKALFEILDGRSSGKMVLYSKGIQAKDKLPIITAGLGEYDTYLAIQDPAPRGGVLLGTNGTSGFIILTNTSGKTIFHKP